MTMNAKTKTKTKKKKDKKTSKEKQSKPKAQTAKANFKTPTSIRIDRLTAAVICLAQIKRKISSTAAVKRADDIYVKAGGKSNLKEAKCSFDRAVRVIALTKMMQISGDEIFCITALFTV